MTFDLLITKRKAKHFVFILQLSVERLSSMKKYFGLGSAQVLVTAVVVGLVSRFIAGQPGPTAIVIGNGLALSSTAVVLQVLQERGESTSRHERATFSVLLFQVPVWSQKLYHLECYEVNELLFGGNYSVF
ncbi:hypothetical protein CsSME_00012795 [Camellia sinensis var. sinensis]